MKLAICEYEDKEREFICNCIRKISENIEVCVFETLNKFLQSEIVPDLIYINVKNETISNYKFAKKIKEKYYKSEIIFTINDISYAVEGYKIGIFRCNLKPIEYEEIEENIKDFIKKRNNQKVFIEENKSSYIISKEEIIYIEVIGKYSTVYTKTKDYKLKMPIKEIEKILDSKIFYKCHRSFLINLRKVEELSEEHNLVRIENDINIPISRNKIKEFKRRILEII